MSAHDIALHRVPHHQGLPAILSDVLGDLSSPGTTSPSPTATRCCKELEGADGVKTGHLAAAGFGLVGSAVREGKRRIIVLQGLTSETERKKEGPRVMRAAFVDFTIGQAGRQGRAGGGGGRLAGREGEGSAGRDAGSQRRRCTSSALKQIKSTVVYKGPLSGAGQGRRYRGRTGDHRARRARTSRSPSRRVHRCRSSACSAARWWV